MTLHQLAPDTRQTPSKPRGTLYPSMSRITRLLGVCCSDIKLDPPSRDGYNKHAEWVFDSDQLPYDE
jgi:hypothetical protein